MFSFLTNKSKKRGIENIVSSDQLTEKSSKQQNGRAVETTLSFHPLWNVPKENEYVYRFLNNDLDPLKPDQLSLAGIEWKESETSTDLEVTAFVRNSLDQGIELGKIELLLLNDKKKVAARQTFDFAQLGTLPPRSSRPWVFRFPKNTFDADVELPKDGWTLAFNVQTIKKHALDLEPSWEEGLSKEQKAELREIVDSLQPLKEKEVNFTGLAAEYQEDGELVVTVFIRNGHTRGITLEKLPLEVTDAAGDLVAKGSFELNLEVKANTSKPWSFIFPVATIQKENADFSKWHVRVPQ